MPAGLAGLRTRQWDRPRRGLWQEPPGSAKAFLNIHLEEMVIHEHNEDYRSEFRTTQPSSRLMWRGSRSAFALEKALLLLMRRRITGEICINLLVNVI